MKLTSETSLSVLIVSFLLQLVVAIKYEVETTTDHHGRGNCIGHRVPGSSLVTGYFRRDRAADPRADILRVSATVYDSLGNQLFSRSGLAAETRFSFRSGEAASDIDFCLRVSAVQGASGNISGLRVPIELVAKWDYDLFDEERAREYKIKPIETEFIQLEEVMHRVANELSEYLRNEEEHRDTNEATLVRVKYFSGMSILVLVSLSLWQLYYLKRFFKTKKLI